MVHKYSNTQTYENYVFRSLSVIHGEIFKKAQYINGYLRHGCAMADLKYKQ
jgi:hypothetical protein